MFTELPTYRNGVPADIGDVVIPVGWWSWLKHFVVRPIHTVVDFIDNKEFLVFDRLNCNVSRVNVADFRLSYRNYAVLFKHNQQSLMSCGTVPAKSFNDGLCAVVNTYSRENASNTPDFILANFMEQCLVAFEEASRKREDWYGTGLTIFGPKTLEVDMPNNESE